MCFPMISQAFRLISGLQIGRKNKGKKYLHIKKLGNNDFKDSL